MTEIQKMMTELKDLRTRQNKMYDELEHSLALCILWPEVFAHGTAKSRFVGQPGRYKLAVTDGAGETREYLWDDLPEVLRAGAQ